VAKPVTTPQQRSLLAEAGAGFCEMEAASVSRAAETRPFSVLKVVSDMAGGAQDSVLTLPGPVAMARFQRRALWLSREFLTPAVIEAVQEF
jgi:nucleoside phosphorylase